METIDEWSDALDLLGVIPVRPFRPRLPRPHDAPEHGKLAKGLDAAVVFAALKRFGTEGVTCVQCYRDEGFPWIEVRFDETRIAGPAEVLAVGAAIDRALASRPLLFHALRPYAAIFLVDEPLSRGHASLLGAGHYGVPFKDLKEAWTAATRWTIDEAEETT